MQKLSQETSPFIGYLLCDLNPQEILFVKEMVHAQLKFDYSLQNDLDVQLLFYFFPIFLHLLSYLEALIFAKQL